MNPSISSWRGSGDAVPLSSVLDLPKFDQKVKVYVYVGGGSVCLVIASPA